jgi:hypothetical protein
MGAGKAAYADSLKRQGVDTLLIICAGEDTSPYTGSERMSTKSSSVMMRMSVPVSVSSANLMEEELLLLPPILLLLDKVNEPVSSS